ncbi:hypothetical protein KP509_35G001200 [Ceratopteris richardii]|uniref:CGL160/ATPI domain-containing protein n=1 Tax=Ceratopteris richardii TaxID=49495 RepID=A0A8T2QDY9_CERRI|nr:hypothetical protein KP509_35G001200 [Ceratopteris richardii]
MAMVYPAATSTLARASLSSPISGSSSSRSEQTQSQTQQLQDPSSEPRLPTRRLPRQRWQWSRGDGPGEYGGPPLDFRVRKTWGEAAPDPITSGDYIWNNDWQSSLPSLEAERLHTPAEKEPEVGFLSLNRSFALNSIDIDLTKELVSPPKSVLTMQVEALREGEPINEAIRQDKPSWRLAPTRKERKKWAQARKAGGGSMAILVSEEDGQLDPIVRKDAVIAKRDYYKLKRDLQILTTVFGAAGLAVCYTSYSSEVALSYGVGLLGSLVYIRMLGNSVESLGKSDGQGAMRAALGQPRILVPVILVMLCNRWND